MMAPKKKMLKPKFQRSELEKLERKELQTLGRAMRKRGEDVGRLDRGTDEIIESLLLIQIVDEPTSSTSGKGSKSTPGESDSPVREERTKLEPPSSLATKPDKATFRLWSQEVAIWRGTHRMHSDSALVSSILKALASAEKSLIFAAHNEENPVTMKSLLSVLALPFAGSELAERQHKLSQFRACTRGGQSLQAFLGDWELKRGQCVMAGTVPSSAGEQDQWDLLKACELSTEQHASIMHELSTRAELREEMSLPVATASEVFETTMKLVRNLALSFELEKGEKPSSSSQKASSAELTAMFAKGKAAGKGKNAKSQSKGASAGAEAECWNCKKTGHFASQCWAAGGGAAKGGKGAGKGKGGGKSGGKGAGKGKSAKKPGVVCYGCGKVGHLKADCWSKPKEGEGGEGPPKSGT